MQLQELETNEARFTKLATWSRWQTSRV